SEPDQLPAPDTESPASPGENGNAFGPFGNLGPDNVSGNGEKDSGPGDKSNSMTDPPNKGPAPSPGLVLAIPPVEVARTGPVGPPQAPACFGPSEAPPPAADFKGGADETKSEGIKGGGGGEENSPPSLAREELSLRAPGDEESDTLTEVPSLPVNLTPQGSGLV